MGYSISAMKQRINDDFTITYKNASNFPSTKLYNDCITIISDFTNLRCIIFANDLGIPPVKSLLMLLSNEGLLDKELEAIESQWVGCLMGFVFKYYFGYKLQKERIAVKMYGVGTATRFLDVEKFTIDKE